MSLPSIFTTPQLVNHRETSDLFCLDLGAHGPPGVGQGRPGKTCLAYEPQVTTTTKLDLMHFGNKCVLVPTIRVRLVDEDESPIPRRATIARGSATRRKVPPISPSSDFYDDNDSAYAPSDEGRSGMNGSLRTIRNSATKKRAEKIFERLDKSSVGSSPSSNADQLEESGIFSASSQHNNEYSARKSTKKQDSKLVHTNSTNGLRGNNNTNANNKRNIVSDADADTDVYGGYSHIHSRNMGAGAGGAGGVVGGGAGMVHIDYNPSSGVTFRENRNSDVQVVGRGYGDDNSSSVSAPAGPTSTTNAGRLKDRRRFSNRGPLISPSALGMAASHLPGFIGPDSEDKLSPSHDASITLVGRGMFEPPSAPSDFGPGIIGGQSQDGRLDRRKMEVKAAPPGVVGIAVRSNADLSSSETSAADEDYEDEHNVTIPQSLKEKVAVKQQQRQEEDERRRAEKERKEREREERREREKEEKLKRERERQQEKLKRLSSAESINSYEFLSISGSGSGTSINSTGQSSISNNIGNSNTFSNGSNVRPINQPPKPQPPAVTPRKTLKTSNESVSTYPMPVSTSSTPMDSEDPSDWKPFKDSDAAFRDMMKKMEQSEWEIKCEGLNMLRRLCMHHPDVVGASLHPIVLAVCNEAKNLRSQVSRLGITAIGDMFANLRKGMDPEVDITTKTLLAKSGESNQFIKEDVDKALCQMVDNVTPQRALLALIGGGASHKNVQIRKLTAQFLVDLVEKMGSGRILSGVKDITDRVLPTAAQFAMDGSQETRYYGRKILYILMSHQDFDKMLTKYLPANTLRNIQDIVDNLKQKGLGERPSELSSARSRRSGQGSRSNSSIRGGSASSSADSGFQQPRRRALMRTDEARMGEVKAMTDLMFANNWQERYEGLTSFLAMCETNPQLVSSQIIKIFDKFLPRLQDSNSKVNLYALKVMLQVTPMLRDSMSSVISMTVGAVAPNLSSKNKEIYTTAAEILEAFIENLELTMLIQPFANQAINATARSKADMVLRVAYLVEKVYPRKQKPIVLHVLPLLWHLMGSMNASGAAIHGGNVDIRQATVTLVTKLYDCMGQGLIEKANAEPSNTQRQIQLLQSLIEDA
ncbi:protein FAM179B-like [Elysia marginata]|uniref:Protein FAM179B-like n=1 Tax=Elysia marginata TaxID=1093978 RepID=A0AAV4GDE0_9GAST|nr:protein FAM179B-like [Elysia marginata]